MFLVPLQRPEQAYILQQQILKNEDLSASQPLVLVFLLL